MSLYRLLVPSVVAASLLAALSLLLVLANRGFNLVDEVSYAYWISSPEQFGPSGYGFLSAAHGSIGSLHIGGRRPGFPCVTADG